MPVLYLQNKCRRMTIIKTQVELHTVVSVVSCVIDSKCSLRGGPAPHVSKTVCQRHCQWRTSTAPATTERSWGSSEGGGGVQRRVSV